MASENQKPKRPLLYLRAVAAFVLLALLLGGFYWLCYNLSPVAAEWETPGSHDTFIYEGELYRLKGTIGKNGLSPKNYPVGDEVGRVRDDGTPVVTEAPTLPPDAEPGETVKVTPPDGDPDLSRDHAYVLYEVENKPHMLLLLERDGDYRLYYREAATWGAPGDHSTLIYEGRTYLLVGPVETGTTLGASYDTDVLLGLVHNDGLVPISPETDSADTGSTDTALTPAEVAKHSFLLRSVKRHANLLLVEGLDGTDYLYYREGSKKPTA